MFDDYNVVSGLGIEISITEGYEISIYMLSISKIVWF